ncbi:MAG: enoyl-CoA hydratase/isomerase family protein [Gammaproteobacteria bacterium]|nr:enoyl-CoA hydratase/isomerase family protein [Gammaproteobacteria bacterium]
MAFIDTRIDDNCFVLTLQGEGKFNPDSLAAFNQSLDDCLANEAVQMLVITGEGKNFSQGLDLEYLMSADPKQALAFVDECMLPVGRLLAFPVPVVAAVNGHAFGLGAMITLASDYKTMRQDRGFFCLPEIDMGTPLVERMNRLVIEKLPGNLLRDVLLTGKRFGGVEACEVGIVDAACAEDQLLATARQLAQPMLGKNRDALGALKRGVNIDILSVIEAG